MKEKRKLRREMRGMIAAASRADVIAASQQICEHFVAAEEILHNSAIIALYAAHGNEVDLSPLHRLLSDSTLLYPLCHSESRLTFHDVRHPQTLTAGKYGILEPDPDQHPELPLDSIDFFLCPGLAFTPDGKRLGQGGGFYDRILSRKKPTSRVIGSCMARQVLENIPCEEHDIQMDYLLTETGLRKTS